MRLRILHETPSRRMSNQADLLALFADPMTMTRSTMGCTYIFSQLKRGSILEDEANPALD